MDQRYFSVQQVADLLGVSAKRIRKAIGLLELRAHRVGGGERGELRIAENDLTDWLNRIATKPRKEEEAADLVAC